MAMDYYLISGRSRVDFLRCLPAAFRSNSVVSQDFSVKWRRRDAGLQQIGPFPATAAGFGGAAVRTAASAFELSTRAFSPYQFNPLDFNLLARHSCAGDRFRAASPGFAGAAADRRDAAAGWAAAPLWARTRSRWRRCSHRHRCRCSIMPSPSTASGIGMAAICANPPLRQLVVEWDAADIMLVQITLEQQDGVLRLPSQIARLADQFTFTGPLRRDIEALDELCALCRKEQIFRLRLCRKRNRLRLPSYRGRAHGPGAPSRECA
jgi:hypothetical protein